MEVINTFVVIKSKLETTPFNYIPHMFSLGKVGGAGFMHFVVTTTWIQKNIINYHIIFQFRVFDENIYNKLLTRNFMYNVFLI